jgi:hypothetical protein
MIEILQDPVWSKVVGVILIVLSFSFAYKTYLALIKGRLLYWDGFLPATILSPWILHLPPKNPKNSLSKYKEAMWVHVVMGPVFLISSLLCLGAGIDLIGLPGTRMINLAIAGGKEGRPPAIVFDKKSGYRFPIIPRTANQLGKMFGGKIGLAKDQQLYEQDNTSLDQAMHR